jgi:hypothetical protein
MRMKELWEAKPKVLRQKWTDPITGSDKWGIIFQGQEGGELTVPGGQGPRPTATRTPVFERQRENEGEKVGPIVGVHSLSTETSIKVYEGRTQYNMWKFIFKEQTRGAVDDETPWGMPPTPIGGVSGRPPGNRTPRPQRTGTPNY